MAARMVQAMTTHSRSDSLLPRVMADIPDETTTHLPHLGGLWDCGMGSKCTLSANALCSIMSTYALIPIQCVH